MKIFVGSANPVKINAVTIASSEQWPEALVEGFDVPSGISEQPWGDEETRLGSENRARGALERGIEVHGISISTTAVLGVGLEGGVIKLNDELWSTVWISVVDVNGVMTASNGARFKVPEIVAKPILAGEEMGPVMDRLFQSMDAKEISTKNGAIGVITQNFVDRTEEYSGIAKLALGLWYGQGWEKNLHLERNY